jgi:hypothetical protein
MGFPLTGKLIDGKASYKWIADNSVNVAGIVSVCSAFLRSSILEDFSKRLPKDTPVRVIARWRLEDLLAGASDLEAYEVCKKMGWDFYICTNFHGKVFVFPPGGILVGSANATGSGLGLLSNSNSEVCTVVEESESNKSLVESLFSSSVKMTDKLFIKLEDVYQHSLKKGITIEWPKFISEEISPSKNFYGKLFISECLSSDGNEILNLSKCMSAEAKADASLLSLPSGQFDPQVVARRLAETKIFALLKSLLEAEDGEIYFGTLTAIIHNHLIEDPAPHRRDVKVIVKNLYSWVSNLEKHLSMEVDRPNHSERIRLVVVN